MVFKSQFKYKGPIIEGGSGVPWHKPQWESEDREPVAPKLEVKRRWISQLKERANSLLLYLFVLCMPSTNWMMSTSPGEGNLPYTVYRF